MNSLSTILIMITLILIITIIMIINHLLMKYWKKNREKMYPFECGFDQSSSSRLPFSIQFFLTSLMFLIFDIEIILMLPLIYLSSSMSTPTIMIFYLFTFTLLISLVMEWLFNYLMWM